MGKNGTTFTVGGSANVVARCGLAALSCSDNALTIGSSATVITDSIATCGTATVPTTNQAVLSEHVTGLKDICDDLSPPTNDTPRTYACAGPKAVATPVAGTYNGGITVKCKTTLAKALAHDPEVQTAYFDGILWVELGEKPGNLLGIISDLIKSLVTSGEVGTLTTAQIARPARTTASVLVPPTSTPIRYISPL